MLPELSVSLGLWPDRPADEALRTARAADDLDYSRLWIGEMATYDAFALGTAVATATGRIPLVLGPLAVAVRTPVQIALGAASVAALTGRPVDVAIGSSSPHVVRAWHGRSPDRPAVALAETARALRPLLDGEAADVAGQVVRTRGFRLRTTPPGSSLTIAAFGPAAVRVAARHADRMVLNLVTPESAARLVGALRVAADEAGRPVPRVACWVAAAVDPAPGTLAQLRRAIVAYLAAPGYGEMFAEAGFGAIVRQAREGAPPAALFDAVPAELVRVVAAVGELGTVRRRLAEYRAAGVDEVALVPCSTRGDPAGVRTLTALA